MSSIDNRIVDMKFQNTSFESGASKTLGTLAKLKEALSFKVGKNGLDEVQNSANRFSMGHVEGAVTGVSKKFLAMSTIAITALANITNRAISAGANIVKSLTIAPIMDGFHEYETQMNSIQTILANTKSQGTNLQDVNKALKELNTYSDKTIYNFTEMARNIGTFTAAGVDLKTSVGSIKGIANLAAISGSSSQQASTAMYQLSQAIASGRVALQDWNSVVNAGMGGATFQKALVRTAQAMGSLKDGAVKTVGPMHQLKVNGESFRESISAKPGQQSWLSSEVLTNTLKQFSGDMTTAQLKAQGFTKSQIKAIQSMGKMGVEAATKVKTLSQLMDTLKEAVGSGWAKSFQTIFGNFNQAKTLFTSVSNTLGGMIQSSAKARNKVLSDWSKGGGRVMLLDGIKNAFDALLAVIKPIREAFRDIFPATTGADLVRLSAAFKQFTAGLMIGSQTAENLKRTFRGVFAVLDIVWQVIKGVASGIGTLIGALAQGSGGVLEFTGNLGDILVRFDEFLKKSGIIQKFFSGLGAILAVPIKLIGALGSALASIFSGFEGSKAKDLDKTLGGIGNKLSPLQVLADRVKSAFSGLGDVFGRIGQALAPIGSAIGKALSGVGDALSKAFGSENFSKTLDAINTGLLAGITLLLKRFITNGFNLNINADVGGGLFSTLKENLQGVTGLLQAMQSQVKSKTLMNIAIALGILTASIVALSMIDSAKLTKAMTAIAVGFGELMVAMTIMSKITGSKGFVKVPALATAMILLSTAVLILSAAVKNLSGLSWEELAKGLVGVAGAMAVLVAATKTMDNKGMILAGTGLLILSAGIKVLASAVGDFGAMDWGTIGKGLAGVAGGLSVVALTMKLMPKSLPITGAGLVIVGAGLKIVASAVSDFGAMDWTTMGKGLAGMAGALLIIAGAVALIPPTLPLTAAGLVLVGVALQSIGSVVQSFGGMSWEEIAKGLITLAGSLVILAGGLYLMSGTLAGSAALVLAAGALALLAPVLVVLGSMSWEGIAKGLVALAGAFTVLGVAGLLLSPLTLVIMGLSVAVLAIGAGLALAGAGALAFASAFAIVVAACTAGGAVIGKMIGMVIHKIPDMFKALGQGIIELAKKLASGGKQFTAAMTTLLSSLIQAVKNNIPKMAATFQTMIDKALSILRNSVPKMIDTGLKIFMALLHGIDKNMSDIVKTAGDIIVKFLNGLSKQLPRIVNAGVKLIISFINGVSKAIDAHSGELGAAGGRLALAIVRGMVKGIASGIGVVRDAAMNLAKHALDSAKNFLGIHSPSKEFMKLGRWSAIGFRDGLVGGLSDVRDAMTQMREALKSEMEKQQKDAEDAKTKLEEVLKSKNASDKEVAAARKRLHDTQEMYGAAKAAREAFMKDMKDEKAQLIELSKSYDTVTQKIEDAKKALDDAIKTRDDAAKSIASQYNSLPDITDETTVSDYTAALQDEALKTQTFLASLNKLVTMGLDDATYQKFLDEGIGIQPFVDELIAGGPEAVKAVNDATDLLGQAANKLGKTASIELYQAGVDSAQGLLKGLQSQKEKIRHEMEEIAALISKTITKKLKIKSPSRVMMEVGRYTNEGLAKGLSDYSGTVKASASDVANTALDAIRSTMSNISDAVDGEMDMSPVIAPVLDLSQVKKDASQIGSALSTKAQIAGVTYGQAASISMGQKTSQASAAQGSTENPGTVINLEQNNYSPKALSPVEIYRQTRNQLSLAKEALTN